MTAAEGSLDTKKRIIAAARNLFAQYGFDGTSVRDIAKSCDVNLAAINYHFKTKENLFWAVMIESHDAAEEFCLHFAKTSKDTVEFAMKLYDRFIEESAMIRNTMKMMLTEGMCPTGEHGQEFVDRPLGPPGGRPLAEFIQRDTSYELSPHGVMFGVKGVFCTVFHWAIMCEATKMKREHKKDVPEEFLTPELIRSDVEHMVRAHLAYLEAHPELFGERS